MFKTNKIYYNTRYPIIFLPIFNIQFKNKYTFNIFGSFEISYSPPYSLPVDLIPLCLTVLKCTSPISITTRTVNSYSFLLYPFFRKYGGEQDYNIIRPPYLITCTVPIQLRKTTEKCILRWRAYAVRGACDVPTVDFRRLGRHEPQDAAAAAAVAAKEDSSYFSRHREADKRRRWLGGGVNGRRREGVLAPLWHTNNSLITIAALNRCSPGRVDAAAESRKPEKLKSDPGREIRLKQIIRRLLRKMLTREQRRRRRRRRL